MTSLAGQVVFVTGASSGFGRACARAFAREGATLLLAARRVERIEAEAGELRRLGARDVRSFRLDVRDASAVAAAIEPRANSAIEVLVNNAGRAGSRSSTREASRTGTR